EMENAHGRNPTANQRREPLPRRPTPLAPATERSMPRPNDLRPKALQTRAVERHRVVREIAAHHTPDPPPHVGRFLVQATSQLRTNRSELEPHALPTGFTLHANPTRPTRFPAEMREPEKVEGLRFPHAALLPSLDGVAPQFHQTRLIRV